MKESWYGVISFDHKVTTLLSGRGGCRRSVALQEEHWRHEREGVLRHQEEALGARYHSRYNRHFVEERGQQADRVLLTTCNRCDAGRDSQGRRVLWCRRCYCNWYVFVLSLFLYPSSPLPIGTSTGSPTDMADVAAARKATRLPVAVGSGIDPTNIVELWNLADVFIVGSYIKV